jgi:hypothetical protein
MYRVTILLLLCVLALAATDSFTIVRVKSGYPIPVNFRLRMPDLPPGVLIVITGTPQYGRLLKADAKTEITQGTTLGNEFAYVVNSDFPKAGNDNVTETISFWYQADDSQPRVDGQFSIVVRNPRPSARNLTFRAVSSKPRLVSLVVRGEGKKELTLRNADLLKSVRVFPPTNDCILTQYDGTAISDETEVTDPSLRLFFGLGTSGQSCSFEFVATGANLLKSNVGKVQLNARIGGKLPRAYSTKAVFRVGFDEVRSLEFIGSTTNPDTNLTFFITSPPKYGKLYFVSDIANANGSNFLKFDDLPKTIYSGPWTRVVLVYRMNKGAFKENVTGSDVIQFKVKDNYQTSAAASVTVTFASGSPPKCSPQIISPVFWDRPVTNIILNYKETSGFSIQKLILLTAPRNAIGDLIFSRQVATKDLDIVNKGKVKPNIELRPLRPGLYFTDRNKRLSYMVRSGTPANVSSNQTYTYRAMNFQGMSCIGSITFEVMPHNQAVVPGAGRAVRRELVRVNDITLLPLWGEANKSVNGAASAVIVSAPKLGSLYVVNADAPYDPTGMYRVRGLDKVTYCRRHKCEKYLGELLTEGATVEQVRLWSRVNLDNSNWRLFVFYKSPPAVESLQTTTDSFEYSFVGKDGSKSTMTQRVVINFKKAKKRVIEVTYKIDSTKRWTTYSEQPETLIKCVVSNTTNQVVAIEEFDMFRRHNKKVDFRLFQFREEGNRLVLAGDRLEKTNKFGLDAQWLHFGNSVVLIPGARSRQQVFQFRARIYNLTATGGIDQNKYEVVRVVVRRENNVPVWVSTPNDVRQELFVGETKPITIQAYDADDDLISFRISQGVTHGILRFQETRFGATTSTIVKSGAVLRIPKGSPFRAQATLFYTAVASPDATYPLEDYFSVFADDGGGVLSERLIVNITQVSDITEKHAQGVILLVPLNIAVYGGAAALAALVIACVMMKRRASRAMYLGLPTSEMQSVGGK